MSGCRVTAGLPWAMALGLVGGIAAQDAVRPSDPDERTETALTRAFETLAREGGEGSYRVRWVRVHLRHAHPDLAAALEPLESWIANASVDDADPTAILEATEAFATRARSLEFDIDPGAPPNTIESGRTDLARSGDLVVSVDRDDAGQAIRAIATDGQQTLLWTADGGQVSYFPARRFRLSHDIDILWGPLSTDPEWHAAMANLVWTSRPLADRAAGAGLLLRSAAPGRFYEIEVDGHGRPIRARRRTVDEPMAPPAHHALYAFGATGNDGDDSPLRLAASLCIRRQSQDRLAVDGALIRDRSSSAPTPDRLKIAVPASARVFAFEPGKPDAQLRIDSPATWPDFVRAHLIVEH